MKKLLLTLFLFVSLKVFSQSVTLTPNGAWVPSMTTTARTALTATDGQLVYDSTTKSFWYYKNTIWQELSSGSTTNYWTASDTNILNNNAGNVGIGTTTPTEKLDIEGKTKTTNLQITSGATNGYVLQSDASGNGSWVAPSSLSSSLFSGLTTNYLQKWNGSTFANSVMYDNGTRMGIGTTAIASESKLALGGVSAVEGGQLQLNASTSGTVAYHLDNFNNSFRVLVGTNFSSSSVRMIIDSNGKVGIGTSNPAEKLDVEGKSKTTEFQMTNGANNGYVLQSDESGNGSWVTPSSLSSSLFSGLTTNYLQKWNGTTLENGLLYDDGTRLSLGTDNPFFGGFFNNSKFTVASSTSNSSDLNVVLAEDSDVAPLLNIGKARGSLSSLQAVQNNDELLVINAQGYGGSTFVRGAKIAAFVDGTPNTLSMPTRLTFSTTKEGSFFASEHLRITSDGYIGVGTTSPTEKLEVLGKTKTTDLQITNGATNGYVLQSDANGNGTWVNPSSFSPVNNWITSGTNQYNSLSGNVGIGTTTPTEKLEVNGKTKTTSFQMTTTPTDGHVLKTDVDGNETWVAPSSLSLFSGLTTNYVQKWNGTTLVNSNLYDNGSGLGIGTSTIPSESRLALAAISSEEGGQLQLNSSFGGTVAFHIDNYNDKLRILGGTNSISGAVRMQIEDDGDTYISKSLGVAATSSNYAPGTQLALGAYSSSEGGRMQLNSSSSGTKAYFIDNYNDKFRISSGTNLTLNTTHLTLDATGIGIGTTSPATKFHVLGNTTLEGTVNFNGNWNMQTGSDLYLEKNGTRYMTVFGTGGNIGIGTPTPSEKLEVSGTIKTTNLTVMGALTLSTVAKTASYSISSADYCVVFSGSTASQTLTLPTSPSAGRVIMIVNHASVAVSTSPSYTTSSGTSSSIIAGGVAQLLYDGTVWRKIN